ncbi:hypothetical protein PG996_007547 [Apiospora saccharicola]|uniref:BRCT domain-containing protein n=1 Tax=Apiospora saccharicola TaxID=335842 RepID=A0ABR1VDW8_9PEZI
MVLAEHAAYLYLVLLTSALNRKKLHIVKVDWLEHSFIQARKPPEKEYLLEQCKQARSREREEHEPIPLRWSGARTPPDKSARAVPPIPQGLQAPLPAEGLRALSERYDRNLCFYYVGATPLPVRK